MSESIIYLKDAEEISTALFPSGRYPFETFNPVQSAVFPIREEDCNAVIAASTSAGKTILSELFATHSIRNQGKSMIYLAPLRALVTEKRDDWTNPNHPFSDCKISVLSGDYKYTEDKIDEVNDSQIIIMTSEMLNHRIRNSSTRKSEYLGNVGTLVVDESHLLTVPGRGIHLEVALMKFTEIYPDCRILLLSATMSNVKNLANWLNHLNKKKTYILESSYRPQPLKVHFNPVSDDFGYDNQVRQMVEDSIALCMTYCEDKFLIFVHTKKIGHHFVHEFNKSGINAVFHNADLNMSDRKEIENNFKSKSKDCRVIVATSTLAWGTNLPARRVIIAGTVRGRQAVENYDIQQMMGRAGRKGYDPQGDVYIFVPASKQRMEIDRIQSKCQIDSHTLDIEQNIYRELSFHLIGEFVKKKFTKDDVISWHSRSFSCFEGIEIHTITLTETLNKLKELGLIKEEGKKYEVTNLGSVSVYNYMCPFVVAALKINFNTLFTNGLQNSHMDIAFALSNHSGFFKEFLSKDDERKIPEFVDSFRTKFGKDISGGIVKASYIYYHLLMGTPVHHFQNLLPTIKFDFERVAGVLKQIDSRVTKWGRSNYFDNISNQIRYGVPAHLVPLVSIPGIGAVRAKRLWDSGFKTAEDVRRNLEYASSVAGVKIK